MCLLRATGKTHLLTGFAIAAAGRKRRVRFARLTTEVRHDRAQRPPALTRNPTSPATSAPRLHQE
ncbi:MAG TPA: hypothetical protein VHY56_09145 [Candidatus Binataceae bacterium]|jgi:hypothetical protein|nr:hypothetical protein [Candidatus Binataceae bacterium]